MAYVIERLFWEQRGMTVQHVVYVEIIYAVVIALLEVPSGYLADRWSRKWMMVLGGFLTCIEFLILIFAENFWHFVIAIIFAAIQGAISSGTSNALLYDSLKSIGEESQFEKVLGRVRFYKYLAAMVAALIGSGIASQFGLVTNYWLSLGSVVIAFLISFSFIEPSLRTAEEQDLDDKDYAKQAFRFLKEQRSIQFVLFYGIIIGSCLNYLHEFWQLYLEWLGIPILFFGVVSAANMFTGSLSGLLAHRIKERYTYKGIFTLILLFFVIGLITMSLVNHPIGILLMWIAFASAGVMEPLLMGYLHHRTPSAFRATVESYYSMALRVSIAIVGLLFGAVANAYGIVGSFFTLGILSALYFGFYLWKARKSIEEN